MMAVLITATTLSFSPAGNAQQEAQSSSSMTFTDVTEVAGIDFRHYNGMDDGYKQIPEDEGAGAAWVDYDRDGFMDLYLINSNRLPGLEPNPKWRSALYHNNGDGTFSDVTAGTPLGAVGYGQGACVGDYDADGDPDLYVTYIGKNRLYRNDGGGEWTDVSVAAGVDDDGWGTSCAFVDYDRDGDLDLFVVRYIQWSIDNLKTASRTIDGQEIKLYVRPREYNGTPDLLYRNNGNGTFTDVSRDTGITHPGNGFVGLCFDYNKDGHIDFYVANDMMENYLYVNQGDGTFREEGLLSGTGYGSMGELQNGMGGAQGDVNNDGWLDIAVTNHQGEACALYLNQEGEYFDYVSDESGLTKATLGVLSWGTVLRDFDHDGDKDMLIANGHVETEEAALPTGVTYKQRDQLLENDGEGKFTDRSTDFGAYFSERHWSRAVATADYDNDGDLDILITINDGRPVLLRNDTANGNNWIQFHLKGTLSHPDALNTILEVHTGDLLQVREVFLSDGYCASHDPRVHVGLGGAGKVDEVLIYWPSGTKQVFSDLGVNQHYRVIENEAIEPLTIPASSH